MARCKRSTGYRSDVTWNKMILMYGQQCAYCEEEPAQSVDHVIPWSYSFDDSIYNLRPCCLWCNIHASDKYFDTFEDKQRFLKKKREGKWAYACRTICTTCLLPYQRPHMTTSLFECPECDPEKINKTQRREWESFKGIMREAGIQFVFHDKIRREGGNLRAKRIELGEMYLRLLLKEDSQVTLADLHKWHVLEA